MNKVVDHRAEELFWFYTKNGGHFFAITSDINLLGLYIAKHSRARAENLVDLYNSVLDGIISDYRQTQDRERERVVFLPSGEETTILGVCSDPLKTEEWISRLALSTQTELASLGLIDPENTRIVFGWSFFESGDILKSIREFVSSHNTTDPRQYAASYYALFEGIRDVLARKIDANKFRHFIEENDKLAILYRNISLAEYAEHKVNTEKLLQSLREYAQQNDLNVPSSLIDEYGVYNGKMGMVRTIKKQISE